MRNTFINNLCELAKSDQSIFLLCGDLGYSVLEPFSRQFPERFINIGIAEQNMTGVAVGLAREGYNVFTADRAQKALDCLRDQNLDLVLTDLVLEEDTISGLEILEEVHKISPDTVVMVITGYGSLSTAIEALRKGAFDYILNQQMIRN